MSVFFFKNCYLFMWGTCMHMCVCVQVNAEARGAVWGKQSWLSVFHNYSLPCSLESGSSIEPEAPYTG